MPVKQFLGTFEKRSPTAYWLEFCDKEYIRKSHSHFSCYLSQPIRQTKTVFTARIAIQQISILKGFKISSRATHLRGKEARHNFCGRRDLANWNSTSAQSIPSQTNQNPYQHRFIRTHNITRTINDF